MCRFAAAAVCMPCDHTNPVSKLTVGDTERGARPAGPLGKERAGCEGHASAARPGTLRACSLRPPPQLLLEDRSSCF